MADRPPRDLDWIPDDSTGIEVPTTPTQNAGWLVEIPPRQFFNWLWNRCTRWFHYLSGQSQEWIVIDSVNTNEKDYDTYDDWYNDAPAADDKLLIKETQVLTAQMVVPDGITLRILNGAEFTRATNEANSVIKWGSNIIIEGILNLVLSQTGTTAKAVEFDGDNVVGKINIENSSTGILTTAYHINTNKTGNRVEGFLDNTGGGTLTNEFVDNSTEDSNLLIIIDAANNTIKTNGTAFVDLLTNQTIAGNKTFSGDTAIASNSPILYLKENDAAVDEKYLRFLSTGGTFFLSLMDDTLSNNFNVIALTRTGWNTCDSFNIATNNLSHNSIKISTISGIDTLSNKTFSDAIIADGGIRTDGANTLKTKVIDIGDWNMYQTGGGSGSDQIDINHGLTLANIRQVRVLIRNDANTLYHHDGDAPIGGSGAVEFGIFNITSTQVRLITKIGGSFDSTDFNATSYNRGWITITYAA